MTGLTSHVQQVGHGARGGGELPRPRHRPLAGGDGGSPHVVTLVCGQVWNDISCYHEKEWICEDSQKLLEKMGLA